MNQNHAIMKKLIIAAAFILLTGVTFSQTLKKGCFLGVQALTITLATDVTMEQYLDFTMNTFIPEAEKHFPGLKVLIMGGGMEMGSGEEAEVKYSVIYYFESAEVQSKYFNEGGNFTEGGTAAIEKLRPTSEKMDKLGTNSAPTLGWMIL
jgi:hypothetical protein